MNSKPTSVEFGKEIPTEIRVIERMTESGSRNDQRMWNDADSCKNGTKDGEYLLESGAKIFGEFGETSDDFKSVSRVLETVRNVPESSEIQRNSSTTKYSLKIEDMSGTKSRVETQIRVSLKLSPAEEQADENSQIKWRNVLVPLDNILQVTHLTPKIKDVDSLSLKVQVFNSALSKTLLACDSCIKREKKSFSKKLRAMHSPLQVEEQITESDRKKIVVINNKQSLSLNNDEISLSLRFTCYCRHHNEKDGFVTELSLYDYNDALVAVVKLPPIKIVDDHKIRSSANTGKKRQMKPSCSGYLNNMEYNLSTTGRNIPEFETTSGNVLGISNIGKRDNGSNGRNSFSSSMISYLNLSTPIIEKVVPNEAPISGNTEVTLLGNGFTKDMTVYFGRRIAEIVGFYDTNAVIVRPPPCHSACSVPVYIRQESGTGAAPICPAMFHYKAPCQKSIYESALQILGYNLNATSGSPVDVALQLLNSAKNKETHSNQSDPLGQATSSHYQVLNYQATNTDRSSIVDCSSDFGDNDNQLIDLPFLYNSGAAKESANHASFKSLYGGYANYRF